MDLLTALRQMSDEDLAGLFALRPDLADPPPPDLETLAERAASFASVQSCLTGLDRFASELVEALCLVPVASPGQALATIVGAPEGCALADLDAGVERLRRRAVIWRHRDGGLHLLPGVREWTRHPAGLGRPLEALLAKANKAEVERTLRHVGLAPSGRKAELMSRLTTGLSDPTVVGDLLAAAPSEAREIVERVAERGPLCRVRGGLQWYAPSPSGPVDWLRQRCLLVAVAWDQAEMPREVGLALRGGRALAAVHPHRPTVATVAVDTEAGTVAAGQAASDTLRAVAAILIAWGASPPNVLKGGGLGVREVKRAAKVAEVDETVAALVVELAYAASLVGVDARSGEVLPTPACDTWLADDVAGRWLHLAGGWVGAHRYPSLAGKRNTQDKPIAPLHHGIEWALAWTQRRAAVEALTELADGTAPEAASLAAAVEWSAPSVWDDGPARQPQLVRWVLDEAALLGVTGQGALSTFGRHLLAGRLDAARQAAAQALGSPASEVTLQADLTAVATGRPTSTLAHELGLMADIESRGPATVWRFSEATVRRALDAGRSAEALTGLLEAHATKGVPQALAYLISDTARRHGGVRVGGASSYARSDDPALVAELCRARQLAKLGLRAVAPTVAVADVAPARLLEALRAAGYLPIEEAADGAVVVSRPEQRRLPPQPGFVPAAASPLPPAATPARSVQQRAALVAALRAAPPPGKAGRSLSDPIAELQLILGPRQPALGASEVWGGAERKSAADPNGIHALLRAAAEGGSVVSIGYEDPRTGWEEELVEVIELTSRTLRARFLPGGGERHLELSQIEWVEDADDDVLVEAW